MKKKIIAATMAAAMCVSLAACGGSTASSSAAESTASSTAESTASSTADAASTGDEEVDLRMAWWGSQDRHDRTIKAIELYESLHPNVKIEYEYYSFDDYFTKLKTLVASDQVWDIFQLGGNFPMYMDKIYPLDDYIASGVVDVSGIGDANLKTTQDTEGHQLGISNGLNSYGIAYDPDMFAEAGVAEPTDTWTWDDYANAANTIHEKLGVYGCSSMLTSEFIAGCSVYVAQYGDVGQYSFFNLDLTGMGFDDPQMLTPYIQMRADSIKNEVYPDAGASAEITNIENDFLVTGEAAMACHIESADDCIVFKTTEKNAYLGPCENIVVSNCTLTSTSAAIKFGTESVSDFRNITVTNCVISRTNRGISLMLRDGGNIENVTFANLHINTRMFSDQWWGEAEAICVTAVDRKQGNRAGHIRNVHFENINCSGENGIFLHGSEGNSLEDISFRHIRVDIRKQTAWPIDHWDLRPSEVPGMIPGKVNGFTCVHGKSIRCEDVVIRKDSSMDPWFDQDFCWQDTENVTVVK